MKQAIVLLVFLFTWTIVCPAQTHGDIYAISRGDSVALYLMTAPSSGEGFLVYRQGPLPTSEGYQLLTTEGLIRPVIEPEKMLAVLGSEWDFVSRLLESDDAFVALRRLRGDEMTSRSLSFITTKVAQVTGRWFCDPTAKRGREYSYRVVFIGDAGKRLDSASVRITLADFVPMPPTNLKAVLEGSSIKLTWDYPAWKGKAEDAAVRFDVYRRVDKGQYEILNTKPILRNDAAKQYVDAVFSYGKEYTYVVTATDPLNRQSKPSTPVAFVPMDKVPPAVPAGLQAQSSERSTLLTWSMSLDLDAAGYNVYRSIGSKEEPKRLTKSLIRVDKPFYVDSTVKSYTQYFYSVSAVDNASNESLRSNPLMAMTKDLTPPDPPSEVSFKVDRHNLNISWKPSPSSDVVGYNVYRGETPDRQPLVNRSILHATAYTDSGYQGKGLIPGRRFFVSVTAVDSARNESKRVTTTVALPDDEAPLPPAMFRAENVDGRYVEIACSPSPSPDAVLYEIFRVDEKNIGLRLFQAPSAPFRYRDTTATKGTRYQYYAMATDTARNQSERSNVETIFFRDFTPPPSPRNVSARVTQKGVEVSWERVVDFDLAGYVVYRSEIPGGSGVKVASVSLKSLTFTDPIGKKDVYYFIRAIDTSGNESVANNEVQAH